MVGLNRLKYLGAINVEIAGLMCAKEVKVRRDRNCYHCNKIIKAGKECITASHKIDKKYNKTFKELYEKGALHNKYSFVSERHWLCLKCAERALNKVEGFKSSEVDWNDVLDNAIDEYDTGRIGADELLEIAGKAYNMSVITSSEYEDISDGVIHYEALADAIGHGQS